MTIRWTEEQACAWAVWRDGEMVARAETATVQQLLDEQRTARRRALWYDDAYPLRALARNPNKPGPPRPVVGSVREFQLAVEQGRLLPNEEGLFDPPEVRTVFPPIKADVPSAISDNRYWIPLCQAIDAIASRQCVASEEAWAIQKAHIAMREIKAQCRALRYDTQHARWTEVWRDFDPTWLSFTAYECPADNHLRFDRTTAIRSQMAGENVDTPPEHARNILVDRARLDELYPAPEPTATPEATPGRANDGAAATRPRRRGRYKGELTVFMTRLGPKMVASLSDDDIARGFMDHIEARTKAGRSALKLPQLRHIANQVAKLRAKDPDGASRNGA
jgi:hypothetical protein